MSKEKKGPWRQISECDECGYIVAKETKWMDGFFVPVCPKCGAHNTGYFGIFRPRTARTVSSRWGGFIRWEFKE